MPSTIFEARIPACVDGAELSGLLACPEFLGLWEQDGALTIYWQGSEKRLLQKMQGFLPNLMPPFRLRRFSFNSSLLKIGMPNGRPQ